MPTFNTAQTNPFGLANMGGAANPTFVDIDNDGDLDAFIGASDSTTDYFQNTGSASAPAFAPVTGLLNPLNGVDVGVSASPTFVDIDNDGDLDAFIGGGGFDSTTDYFQNTGSASAPAFATEITTPFGLADVGGYASPTLVDIDNDGDLDAFIGAMDGNISYFQNTGSASAPAFATPVTNDFGLANVGFYASPTFVDIDNDGDLDAFIGAMDGNISYFQNTGSASAPAFATPVTNPFNLTNVGVLASPTFVDIDNDGDLDAFIGAMDGNISYFEDPTPGVSIAPGTTPAEGGATGTFTLTLSETATADITINYTVTGTATSGTDYTALSGTVTIPTGSTTATIDVTPTDDAIVDPGETVIVALNTGTGYNVGATPNDTATLTITDNDIANTAPVVSSAIADTTATATTAFSLTLATDTFNDADGDTLTYSATLDDGSALPTWLSFDAATGTFSGTPTDTDIGTLTLKVTASDGSESVSDSFTLTVDDIPTAPTISTTGTTNGEITGTGEAGSTVELFQDGTSIGTATVDADGNWTLTPTTLTEGTTNFTATATDAAGNTSTASTASSLTVDATAPTAPSIATSETTNGEITGTGEAGSTVELFQDGTSIGTATVDADGNWTLTPTTAIAEGTYNFTATATDAAGNTSTASTASSLTVDATAPTAPSIATSETTNGEITGTGEAGSTVELFQDGTSIGTATVDADGNWTLTPTTAIAEGTYNFTATATDAAGNTSTASTASSLTVDATAPTAPSIATSETTNGEITGTGEAGSTVELFQDGTSIGTATVDADGNWTLTPTTAIAEGTYNFTATATDAAGNTSTASTASSLTIDATAPTAPSIATSETTNGEITGTGEAGSTVELFQDGTSIGTATVDADGNWTLTPTTAIAEGTYNFTATATDAAGNTSTASTASSLTVDATAPTAPTIATTATTDDTTPDITGTAEAGSTVTIFSGTTELGTVTAGADGTWTFTSATALADGDYTLTATATDAAGNTSVASAVSSLTIDPIVQPSPLIIQIFGPTGPDYFNQFLANNPDSALNNPVSTPQVDAASILSDVPDICNLLVTMPTLPTLGNTIAGTPGMDILIGTQEAESLIGTNEGIFIQGLAGNDQIFGGISNDNIHGNQGEDFIDAGPGDDLVHGGQGNDYIVANSGNNEMYGDLGNDTLVGGPGNDFMNGNQGNDVLFAVAGNNTLHGGQGDDSLIGGIGDDILFGDKGNDIICAGAGNNFINGNQGNDTLTGGDGDDVLYGGKDDDLLIGGAGNDWLSGDLGNDILIGGAGQDRFVIRSGAGVDVIVDFTDGEDLIGLAQGLTYNNLTLTQGDNGAVISVGNEVLAIVNGVNIAVLDQQDFFAVT